jgi:hypothetical protein
VNPEKGNEMKLLTRILIVALSAMLIGSCQTPPQPIALNIPIVPRQPQKGDTWCNYLIQKSTGECDRQGKEICLLCKDFVDPKTKHCPLKLTVSPAKGCVWELIPLAPGMHPCEDCKAKPGATYQRRR